GRLAKLAGLVEHVLDRQHLARRSLLLPGAVLAPVAGRELHGRAVGERHRDAGDALAAAGAAGDALTGAALGQRAERDVGGSRGTGHQGLLWGYGGRRVTAERWNREPRGRRGRRMRTKIAGSRVSAAIQPSSGSVAVTEKASAQLPQVL